MCEGKNSWWCLLSSDREILKVLCEVQLNITNEDKCKDHFGDLMSCNIICAHSDSIDTCDGDPGGPSSINRNNKYYQIGVISFGDKNCGELPRVFENLGHRKIKKFINEKMCSFFIMQALDRCMG